MDRIPDSGHGANPIDCPTWCRRPHDATDHPEDTGHSTTPSWIPATHLQTRYSPDATAAVYNFHTSGLIVAVEQPAGVADAWLAIAAEEGSSSSITLSLESAARLAQAIGEQLAALRH